MAGTTITIIGGLIAGIDRLWDPVRLIYLGMVLGTTSVAMISFMFLLMVRVSDPLVPRAIFGVLNTLLYFPSGAIYPIEGFPGVAAMDFLYRSVYLCRACAQGLAPEECGIHGHLLGHSHSGRIFCCPGQSFCRIFQEADIKCEEEIHSWAYSIAGAEEPKSKALRYVISGVALVLLIAAGLWYLLRYTHGKAHGRALHERGRRGRYAAGLSNLASASGFFLPGLHRFLGTRTATTVRSRVIRIESAEVPPKGGSGVVVTVEISAYTPFPKPEETDKVCAES